MTLALSIRQPWPALITRAGCRVINRHWPTDHRGRVMLHVSKTPCNSREWAEAIDIFALAHPAPRSVYFPLPADMPRGGLFASALLVDCVSRPPSDAMGGRWFVGPYGFLLRDVRPIPFRRWPGNIGLFEVPDFTA